MKQKILFKGQTEYGHWVKGSLDVDAFDNHIIITYQKAGRAQHCDKYAVKPETVGRLVYEKDNVQYFTGDKLAIYTEGYENFEDALADGSACVSEINANGLVVIEYDEIYIAVEDLKGCCYEANIITNEEYEKILEG